MLCLGAIGLGVLLIARGNLKTLFNNKAFEVTHYISRDEMKLIDEDKKHIYIMPSDFLLR